MLVPALRLPSVTAPDVSALPWVPRVRRIGALLSGVVDLAGGAMLLALASGVGVVAPVVLGGFGTAIVVGLAGAVSLGLARTLGSPGVVRDSVATVSRLGSVIGHVLVLASVTGVAAIVAASIVSLLLSVVVLVAVLVPWVVAWRSRR